MNTQTLQETAANLAAAEAALVVAERQVQEATNALRQENIKALADKNTMYDAFYVMAVQSHEVERLKNAVENFDAEHDRAMKERNAAGDQLDYMALHLGRSASQEDLERASVRFHAAQSVLDLLQKGEAQAKRRADAVALRAAEALYAEMRSTYQDKKEVFDSQTRRTESFDHDWNMALKNRQDCYQHIDACRQALRRAARDFASRQA